MTLITPNGEIAKKASFIGDRLLSLRENALDDGLCEKSDLASDFINGKLLSCSKKNVSYNNFFDKSNTGIIKF